MKLFEDIVELFCITELEEMTENNVEFICTFNNCENPYKPTKNELLAQLVKFPDRDTIEINCDFKDQGIVALTSVQEPDIDTFLEELEVQLNIRNESDSFVVTIKIFKQRVNKITSVYSLKSIVNFWTENGVVSSFNRIQELSKSASTLRVYDLDQEFGTGCLLFTPFDSTNVFSSDINRNELHSKRDIAGHFSGSSQFSFIPDDYQFINPITNHQTLINLFNKLKLISSLVYLSDFTKFSETESIHLRLNGYRLFTKDLTKSDVFPTLSANEYYDIYCWVFSEGNIVDKVGLARNIISLHLEDNDLLKIEKNTLQSISSGYQIYLKDNVIQYIEIKNKLSEFIQNSSDKASEIVKNVGSYYKGSIWTMYTFFITVFLVEIISKAHAEKFITHQLFVLFLVFCIISLIVMNFALKELDTEKMRLSQSYDSLVKRYEDLLLKEDLSKVLGNDRQHNEDIEFIDSKRKAYKKLWWKSLAVIFIVICSFWYFDNKESIDHIAKEFKVYFEEIKEKNNLTSG